MRALCIGLILSTAAAAQESGHTLLPAPVPTYETYSFPFGKARAIDIGAMQGFVQGVPWRAETLYSKQMKGLDYDFGPLYLPNYVHEIELSRNRLTLDSAYAACYEHQLAILDELLKDPYRNSQVKHLFRGIVVQAADSNPEANDRDPHFRAKAFASGKIYPSYGFRNVEWKNSDPGQPENMGHLVVRFLASDRVKPLMHFCPVGGCKDQRILEHCRFIEKEDIERAIDAEIAEYRSYRVGRSPTPTK